MALIASTPQPPYFAVIFTSVRVSANDGYSKAAELMLQLASEQPGFLGFESARQELGVSVSYWSSPEAIAAWKENAAHRVAQNRARKWYREFRVRICRVEREYGFSVEQAEAEGQKMLPAFAGRLGQEILM